MVMVLEVQLFVFLIDSVYLGNSLSKPV